MELSLMERDRAAVMRQVREGTLAASEGAAAGGTAAPDEATDAASCT